MYQNLQNLLEYPDPCKIFTINLLSYQLIKFYLNFHRSEFDEVNKGIILAFELLLVV
jgi:hypothetical protein